MGSVWQSMQYNSDTIAQQVDVIVKVLMAGFLGGLIGLERERAGKPAGLRTQILIASTSALLVGISGLMAQSFEGVATGLVRADPIRSIQAIITGIGFIGAGTIMFRRKEHHVEGLTTAATILLSAGIGIAVAVNLWVAAVVVTGVALVTLSVLGRVERRFVNGSRKRPPSGGM
ncbi:MAG: MgtC/SapB family protein [Phycisphaeraceae bacterium]|nr:MgtC/SapB family protein [Phycisphaeraceae bacterium]